MCPLQSIFKNSRRKCLELKTGYGNMHLFVHIYWRERKVGTGGPRYMRSFYLQFRIYAIRKWPFFWNLSSNLQSSLVFLYANSLYASLFLESLSLEYNETLVNIKNLKSGVDFINLLWAAFTQTDPKSAKKTLKLSVFCTFGICVRKSWS